MNKAKKFKQKQRKQKYQDQLKDVMTDTINKGWTDVLNRSIELQNLEPNKPHLPNEYLMGSLLRGIDYRFKHMLNQKRNAPRSRIQLQSYVGQRLQVYGIITEFKKFKDDIIDRVLLLEPKFIEPMTHKPVRIDDHIWINVSDIKTKNDHAYPLMIGDSAQFEAEVVQYRGRISYHKTRGWHGQARGQTHGVKYGFQNITQFETGYLMTSDTEHTFFPSLNYKHYNYNKYIWNGTKYIQNPNYDDEIYAYIDVANPQTQDDWHAIFTYYEDVKLMRVLAVYDEPYEKYLKLIRAIVKWREEAWTDEEPESK